MNLHKRQSNFYFIDIFELKESQNNCILMDQYGDYERGKTKKGTNKGMSSVAITCNKEYKWTMKSCELELSFFQIFSRISRLFQAELFAPLAKQQRRRQQQNRGKFRTFRYFEQVAIVLKNRSCTVSQLT